MLFDEFDRDLRHQLYQAIADGKDGIFEDPQYPFKVTVTKVDRAWEIKIEDVRKRWWGRTVYKKRTTSKPIEVGISLTQGPAFEALMSLRWVLEAERQG